MAEIIENLITSRQQMVLDCLLRGETIRAAAELSEVSERQIFRWLGQDDFRSALRQAQLLQLEGTGIQLCGLTQQAVAILAGLLSEPPKRSADLAAAGLQRKVAKDILEVALRWREQVDFDHRLMALEKVVRHDKIQRTTSRDPGDEDQEWADALRGSV